MQVEGAMDNLPSWKNRGVFEHAVKAGPTWRADLNAVERFRAHVFRRACREQLAQICDRGKNRSTIHHSDWQRRETSEIGTTYAQICISEFLQQVSRNCSFREELHRAVSIARLAATLECER